MKPILLSEKTELVYKTRANMNIASPFSLQNTHFYWYHSRLNKFAHTLGHYNLVALLLLAAWHHFPR
jgi:hypothetical protein